MMDINLEKRKKYNREYMREYRKSLKYKMYRCKYLNSPKGRVSQKKSAQKRRNSFECKEYMREYDASPKGQEIIKRYNHSSIGKENIRRNHLKKNYNMTIDDYDKMFDDHLGKCAICSELPKKNRRLCVDHNHTTNKIRGLVCDRCNSILGYCHDSTSVLQEAIHYLQKYTEILKLGGVSQKYPKIRTRKNTYQSKDSQRGGRLKFKYNMTITDYDNLCNEQHGKCAICFGPPTRNNFDVDHRHNTSQIRGLLCNTCNLMLGHCNDSILILQRAIRYLERYS